MFQGVIAGLDPAIHPFREFRKMDARVIHDQVGDGRPRMTNVGFRQKVERFQSPR
jgi:hypothetical protein